MLDSFILNRITLICMLSEGYIVRAVYIYIDILKEICQFYYGFVVSSFVSLGFRGVYQGLTATIMKQGSNQAIRFYVMETCKDKYRGGDPTKPVPKLVVGMFGAVAGAASVFGNTPIDVVKTRMQGLEASKYKGTMDCFVQIWKNEGPAA